MADYKDFIPAGDDLGGQGDGGGFKDFVPVPEPVKKPETPAAPVVPEPAAPAPEPQPTVEPVAPAETPAPAPAPKTTKTK